MLNQGTIRPSNSPWSSPINLNEKTIDNSFSLLNITDVLDKIGKYMYSTTLDLTSGFHHIEIDPQNVSKTAFNVDNGYYEYIRIPFGLKNPPATFERVMNNVLGLQNEFCLVYLNGIIVMSASFQEHIVHLTKVFRRSRDTKFTIQLDKSEFLLRK